MKAVLFSLGVLLATAGGCARSSAPQAIDLGKHDLANGGGGDDLAPTGDDLATSDGQSADGPGSDGGKLDAATPDLAGADLRNVDFAAPPDLATPDLSPPADLAAADLATPPDMSRPCTILPQSGCGAGEKCTLGASNSPTCVSTGTQQNGQPCGTAGSDDCITGDLCTADAPPPAPAICRGFCTSDTQCTQLAVGQVNNKAHCIITITGTPYKVCTVACNPVTAAGISGCAPGQACIYGGAPGVPELTDCETGGAGTDGASCAGTQDCANGFACVGPVGGSVCRQMCRNPQNPHGPNNDCSNFLDDCYQPAGVTNPMFGFCCDFISGC